LAIANWGGQYLQKWCKKFSIYIELRLT
jgi:hypothetical protein